MTGNKISDRIEIILDHFGISKRDRTGVLANICGLSPQAIYKWFDGSTHNPTAENLAAIAKYYKVDLMWLITGEKAEMSFSFEKDNNSSPDKID